MHRMLTCSPLRQHSLQAAPDVKESPSEEATWEISWPGTVVYVSVALPEGLLTAENWSHAGHVALLTSSGHGMPMAYGKLRALVSWSNLGKVHDAASNTTAIARTST